MLVPVLVLFIGQSNMDGFGNMGPAPYAPTPRVQIWTGRTFETMQPGVNTGGGSSQPAWGPEVEFANRWLAANAQDVLYLGKVSAGGAGLAPDDAATDWAPGSSGEMHHFARITARRMQAATGASHMDVIMMQGETDAAHPAKARAYGAHLRAFIASARAGFLIQPDPEMRFILGCFDDRAPYAPLVWAAQTAVVQADPLTSCVDARGLSIAIRDAVLSTDVQLCKNGCELLLQFRDTATAFVQLSLLLRKLSFQGLDGLRLIEEGATEWRTPPLPLMFQSETAFGHDGAVLGAGGRRQ